MGEIRRFAADDDSGATKELLIVEKTLRGPHMCQPVAPVDTCPIVALSHREKRYAYSLRVVSHLNKLCHMS